MFFSLKINFVLTISEDHEEMSYTVIEWGIKRCVWSKVISTSILCVDMPAAKALTRLRECGGSSEHWLLFCVINEGTKLSSVIPGFK